VLTSPAPSIPLFTWM